MTYEPNLQEESAISLSNTLLTYLIESAEHVFEYALTEQLNLDIKLPSIPIHLHVPEMKAIMDNLREEDWFIDLLEDMYQEGTLYSLFLDLGYSTSAFMDAGLFYGPPEDIYIDWDPVSWFFYEFTRDYYFALANDSRDEFIQVVRDWMLGTRTVTLTIYLDSPLKDTISITNQKNSDLNITLTPFRAFKVIHWRNTNPRSLDEILVFSGPEFDVPDCRFSPPLIESEFIDWKKTRFFFYPNTRLDVSLSIPGLAFHKQFGNYIKRKEPSFLFLGLNIAGVFMTFFNLLGLPSDIIEYSVFYDVKWDPLLPEKFLLYPNKPVYLKELIIKGEPIKELAKNRYYFCQSDPKIAAFSKLKKFWLKYSEILLKIESHPPISIACRSLSESYKKNRAVDSFIEFMIGLEALYGASEQISYKLPLLISSLYPLEQRKQKFELLRDLYRLRSQIVHGEDYNKVLEKLKNKQNEIDSFEDIINHARSFLIHGILIYMDLLLDLPKDQQKSQAKVNIIKKLETWILAGSSEVS